MEIGFTDGGNSFGDHVISGIRGLKPLIRKVKHFFGKRDHEAFLEKRNKAMFWRKKEGQ